MRQRRKYRFRDPKPLLPSMQPETKKGIYIVLIFALAFISLLSLFNLAGGLGSFVNNVLKNAFGWGAITFPLILIMVGYLMLNQEKFQASFRNFFGLFLLFLSLSGFLQSFINFNEEVTVQIGQGGGYFGYAIDYPLKQLMGWWAAIIVLIALLIISLLLTFNTSIKSLLTFFPALWKKITSLFTVKTINPYPDQPLPMEKEELSDEDTSAKKIKEKDSGPLKENLEEAYVNLPKKHFAKIDIPLDLLDGHSSKPTSGDIKANMEKIRATLEHFGILVEMGEVNVGPTVTQFTLKPSDGMKLSKIVALQNDLSLALAAHPIRIEAPIPGKSLVGIEVPNQAVAIVKLKEILESTSFQNRRGDLYFAVGKDVAGLCFAANLENMPHLLIAGATGSGKSVCINNIIMSLLFQNSPDNLKLILVDPKRVEMTNYNDIPHLLTPVITEVDKTINALRWVVNEMDERYKFLSKNNKRNIASYNQSVLVNKMPYIVIVIDELADLMAVAPREVESAIIRLAQMARAVGIHLVMATQRPSVNVITGLIKANITSRIAFAVASQIDSRTILDCSGAEKLLGKGDLLFVSAEFAKPKRMQGAYITDKEIERITGFLKEKAKPDYQEAVIQRQSKSLGISFSDESGDDDDLFAEAQEVVLKANKASASLLQRRLRVGYARAARLLDLMEEKGIIGPADGAKPREILMSEEAANNNYEEDDLTDEIQEPETPEEELESENDEEIKENLKIT